MKLRYLLLGLNLVFAAENILAQTNPTQRLILPYFDKNSQSNITVLICNLRGVVPCPPEYTNVLSNTNLFGRTQQEMIADVFAKYRNVTTNSGPPGTVRIRLYTTNHIVKFGNRIFTSTNVVVIFRYTNSDATDAVTFSPVSLSSSFRTKSKTGYIAYFDRTGSGTLFAFGEVKHGLLNGLLAEFVDDCPQGADWSLRRANFAAGRLLEYRRYTNGLVFGKYLMWDPQSGRLLIEAVFQEPYDWNKHYRPPLE